VIEKDPRGERDEWIGPIDVGPIDVEIDEAIVVVVGPRAIEEASISGRQIRDDRTVRDAAERAVSVVAIEGVPVAIGQEQIEEAALSWSAQHGAYVPSTRSVSPVVKTLVKTPVPRVDRIVLDLLRFVDLGGRLLPPSME
jgi:hypothetical protein